MKTRIKHLFDVIRLSFYDPAFYKKIRHQRVEEAAKVQALLGVIGVSIASLGVYALMIVPFAFSGFPETIKSAYPQDLVVTLAHGAVSTNQPEPYFIKNIFPDKEIRNLVVIDTGDKLPIDLRADSTYVLVKKTFLVSGAPGQERISVFGSDPATSTLTYEKVAGTIDQVKPYFAPLVLIGSLFILVITVLIVTLIWVVFHLVYILVPAFLIYLYSILRKDRMVYRGAYVVTLYASIPVAILSYVLTFARMPLPQYTYTLLVLLIVAANLSRVEKQGE